MEQIHHPFLWYPWLWEKLRKNEYAFRDIYHITIDEEFEHFLFIKNDNQHVNIFELGANCYDNAITIPNLIKRKENHIAHVLEVVMWEYIGDCSVCIYPFIWKDLELLIPMFLYHLIVKWKIKKKNYWVMIIRFLIALLKSKRKLNIKIREENIKIFKENNTNVIKHCLKCLIGSSNNGIFVSIEENFYKRITKSQKIYCFHIYSIFIKIICHDNLFLNKNILLLNQRK